MAAVADGDEVIIIKGRTGLKVRTISFFEHQFRRYDELEAAADDGFFAALEGLNSAAGCEILRLERTGLRAMNRVGVLHAGDVVIEILPKIDFAGGGSSQIRSAAVNLLAMLSYASDFPLYAEHQTALEAQPGGWMEFLTRLFATHLHRQFLSGATLDYVRLEERLPVLRGKWDLGRQSRRPAYERQSFEVSYDDLTADIPINRVFRYVVNELLAVCQDPENQERLRRLEGYLQPVTLLSEITSHTLVQVRFNRLNERFQPVFNLARLFLMGRAVRLRAGQSSAFAFVFEMDRLFEQFTARMFERFHKQILPDDPYGVRIVVQSAGLRNYLAEDAGKKVLRIIPDLVFQRSESSAPFLVADTKYKSLALAQKPGGGVLAEDVYQMLAYLVRLDCRKGLLIYPQDGAGGFIRRRLLLKTPGLEISACSLNLHVPLEKPDAVTGELREIMSQVLTEPVS